MPLNRQVVALSSERGARFSVRISTTVFHWFYLLSRSAMPGIGGVVCPSQVGTT